MPTTLRKVEPPGRAIWLDGKDYYVKVEFTGRFWTAVELDCFGGFRRRLYDGRSE